jgi:hypothetical protein
MLKKNHATTLKNDSTMGIVYSCVANGVSTRAEIIKSTKLRHGQVKSALYNLVFVGMLTFEKVNHGSAVYSLVGVGDSFCDCFKGVNSVFNHKALPDERINI